MLYSELNRRDFVRTVSAGMALLPALGTSALAEILGPPRSRVAVVRTTDRKRGVTQALKLLDVRGVKGKRVVVKPNFNSADPTPASTHNDTLSQLVTELHERGARSITLGESSGPPQTRGVLEQKGTLDLARDLRFDVVNFEEIPETDWVPIGPAGTNWPEGFHLPRLVDHRTVHGVDVLPEDARVRRRVHDVAEVVGRPHTETDPARHAPIARHAAHDRGAEHRLQT